MAGVTPKQKALTTSGGAAQAAARTCRARTCARCMVANGSWNPSLGFKRATSLPVGAVQHATENRWTAP